MGDPFTISRHPVEPTRIAEAEHHAHGARPHAAKSGRLAPTDAPREVPLDVSQTGELPPQQASDNALSALRVFQAAREVNQINVDGLKSTASKATADNLKLALAVEKAAKKHAKDNHYDLSRDDAGKLSDRVFRAFRWWQQAQETELGLLLTREDDIVNAITGQLKVSPRVAALVDRNIEAWTDALKKAKAMQDQAALKNELIDLEVRVCQEELEIAEMYKESLTQPPLDERGLTEDIRRLQGDRDPTKTPNQAR